MNLNDLQENIDKLDLEKGKVSSILNLIDLKINNDMDKVLAEFAKMNSEMKRVEDKIDTRTSMILWAMGVLIALLLAVVGKSLIS
jgi:peptidoglycan hydrolase CwlO-like protein